MNITVAKIEALSQRLERAKKIVDSGLVENIGDGRYIVLSQQGRSHYNVDATGCDCPDSVRRYDLTGGFCKHRLAVELFKDMQPASYDLQDTIESLYGPRTKA